jgi:hypothetical protein
MKRILLTVILAVSLSACTTIKEMVPSFWDDNQSASIITVRLSIEKIDCQQDQLTQALKIEDQVTWFQLYSESKGWRQTDVLRVVAPMKETLDDWVKRSREKQGSTGYCEIKKKLLQTQAKTAAAAVLGRF